MVGTLNEIKYLAKKVQINDSLLGSGEKDRDPTEGSLLVREWRTLLYCNRGELFCSQVQS